MALPSIGALTLRRLLKRRALAGAQLLAMALAIGVPISLQSVTTVAGDVGYRTVIDVTSRESLDSVRLGLELAAALQYTTQAALQRYLGDVIDLQSLEVTSQDSTLSVVVKYIVKRTGDSQTENFVRSAPDA